MWQLWVENDNQQFEKIGPPQSAIDANLWLQVLGGHFGCEVRLRLTEPAQATITARSEWPGE